MCFQVQVWSENGSVLAGFTVRLVFSFQIDWIRAKLDEIDANESLKLFYYRRAY